MTVLVANHKRTDESGLTRKGPTGINRDKNVDYAPDNLVIQQLLAGAPDRSVRPCVIQSGALRIPTFFLVSCFLPPDVLVVISISTVPVVEMETFSSLRLVFLLLIAFLLSKACLPQI